MNLPPQLPSSEESEQQPSLHSSEETLIQPSPTSDSLPEEEETEQQPAATPEQEETEVDAVEKSENTVAEEGDAVVVDEGEVTVIGEGAAVVVDEGAAIGADGSEDTVANEGEVVVVEEVEGTVADDGEVTVVEEEDIFDSEPVQSGIFIPRGILIALACAVVAIILVASLLLFINRPKDPPTDWIASYIPPSGSTTGKTLYYLHWTNQNGELNGQLQLAANPNGTPQSLTALATGLYNRDNHIIYVVITINGQADTLTGKVNDNNDTLTLNLVGATSTDGQLVFHTGTANDYKQATQKLGPTKK